MSVKLLGSIQRYLGLSTDTKPTGVPVGSTFFETNTQNLYVYDGSAWSLANPAVQTGDTINIANVQLTGSIESMTSAPVVGVKTVTSTAAEIFAGSSAKPNRQKLILKNEDPVLRFRIGPSTVTQQNGFPIEPGAVVEIQFNPSTAVPVYAISEGVSLQVAVMEI